MRRLVLLAVALAACTSTALAHPLGNFTINHYARLEPRADRIDVTVLLDMAEIPTFQEMTRLDADGDDSVSAAERAAYGRTAAPSLLRTLTLTCDGRRVPLRVAGQSVTLREGQGGLNCLRWELHLRGAYPAGDGARRLAFRDDAFAERLGWREIVVRPGDDVRLTASTAARAERSQMLTAYPEDLLQAPLDERAAMCTVVLPVAAAAPAPAPVEPTVAASAHPTAAPPHTAPRVALPTDRFAALITHETLTWPVMLLSLLVALGLGALHALSPGHGKSVVAAYLVGSRGTPRHAIFLGLVITATHTAGVFALGLVTLAASRWIMTESLYPWLGFASGMMVALIGGMLFHERVERLIGRTVEHRHLFWSHSHTPAAATGADASLSWRSLAGLGISGGLVPCPSAIVVMLSAIALHRAGFGLLLIVAFSLGLALVLVTLGVLFVSGSRLLPRFASAGGVLRVVPLGSAIVVALLGVAMAVQSLIAGGVLRLHA